MDEQTYRVYKINLISSCGHPYDLLNIAHLISPRGRSIIAGGRNKEFISMGEFFKKITLIKNIL